MKRIKIIKDKNRNKPMRPKKSGNKPMTVGKKIREVNQEGKRNERNKV